MDLQDLILCGGPGRPVQIKCFLRMAEYISHHGLGGGDTLAVRVDVGGFLRASHVKQQGLLPCAASALGALRAGRKLGNTVKAKRAKKDLAGGDQVEPRYADHVEQRHVDHAEPRHGDQVEPCHVDQAEQRHLDEAEPRHVDQVEQQVDADGGAGLEEESCSDREWGVGVAGPPAGSTGDPHAPEVRRVPWACSLQVVTSRSTT